MTDEFKLKLEEFIRKIMNINKTMKVDMDNQVWVTLLVKNIHDELGKFVRNENDKLKVYGIITQIGKEFDLDITKHLKF